MELYGCPVQTENISPFPVMGKHLQFREINNSGGGKGKQTGKKSCMKKYFSVIRSKDSSALWTVGLTDELDHLSGKYVYLADGPEEPGAELFREMRSALSRPADLILPVPHSAFSEDEAWEEPVTGPARSVMERFRCFPVLGGALIRKKFLRRVLRDNPHDWVHSPCPDLALLLFCSPRVTVFRTGRLFGEEYFTRSVRAFHQAAALLENEALSVRAGLLRYEDHLVDAAVRLNLPSEKMLELFGPAAVTYNSFTRHPQLLNGLRLSRPPIRTGPVRNLAVFCWGLRSGGIERVASLLLEHFGQQKDLRLHLFQDTPRKEGDYPCPENAEITVLSKDPFERRVQTADLFRGKGIDTCIFLDYYKPESFWDILTASQAGVRTIAMVHSVFYSVLLSGQPELLALRKTVYPAADVVTCLSRSDEFLWNELGINARYMPNPLTIDTSARPPFSERNNKTLVFIARMTPAKGALDALKAVGIVRRKHPDVKLYMLGSFPDPEYERECRGYVKAHDLDANVIFAGFTAEVGKYIAESSIHLMPSAVEGYPMTLMEVKSCGLPSVIYSLPYLEAGKEEYGTLSVPQRDWQAMAEKISELLDEPGKLNRFARSAYDSLQWFGNPMVFSRWQALFQRLETGVEPAELAVPEMSDGRKLELLKFQTEGIISGIETMNASVVYREKMANDISAELRRKNLLYDAVMRLYFAMRKKTESRTLRFCLKTLLASWRLKRIYRWFKPWQDEEQTL